MSLVNALLEQNYSVLYSSPFYLDNLVNTWDSMYSNSDLDPAPLPGFHGAEACMWGEHVDETNALSRVWPRAAALAEILWSGGWDEYPRIPNFNSDRLAAWRCRVRHRGVAAEPVLPSWCPLAPH